jgi:hypothetical protein
MADDGQLSHCYLTFQLAHHTTSIADRIEGFGMQPLGVLLLDARHAHHAAGVRFAAQMAAERALHPLDVDPVGLGGLRSPIYQQARGIKDMIVHPMRFQEIVQPEPVVTRLVARDRLDLVDQPAEFTGNLTPQPLDLEQGFPVPGSQLELAGLSWDQRPDHRTRKGLPSSLAQLRTDVWRQCS